MATQSLAHTAHPSTEEAARPRRAPPRLQRRLSLARSSFDERAKRQRSSPCARTLQIVPRPDTHASTTARELHRPD